jgi:hypothetical protein
VAERTKDINHDIPYHLVERIHPDINQLIDNTALKVEQNDK